MLAKMVVRDEDDDDVPQSDLHKYEVPSEHELEDDEEEDDEDQEEEEDEEEEVEEEEDDEDEDGEDDGEEGENDEGPHSEVSDSSYASSDIPAKQSGDGHMQPSHSLGGSDQQSTSADYRKVNTNTINQPASPQQGILSTLVTVFSNFIDPELTEEDLANIEKEIAEKSVTQHITSAYDPEADFMEGRKLFEARKWDKAARYFESVAVQCNHVEAMKYLIDIYQPSRLANTSKVSEWTKRRMAVVNTPEGMLSHGLFLMRTAHQPPAQASSLLSYVTGSSAAEKEAAIAARTAEAVVLIRGAADAGHAPAMHEFGKYLRSKDKGTEAMAWFHRAVDAGYEPSEEFLARGYESGIGVPVDLVAGAHWRARVRERQRLQDEIEEKERVKREELKAKVREEAIIRFRERRKIEDDLKKRQEDLKVRRTLDSALNSAIRSIEWGFYQSGIEQLHNLAVLKGNADARDFLNPEVSPIQLTAYTAMFYLGQYHASHADFATAVKWYRRSAEAGYHEAQVTYAAYLIVGKGMESADPGQAMVWLMKAWETGKNKEAALALGEAYTKGIGVMPDPNKAVKWYIKAWETGEFPEAAFAVGLAYATGYTPGAVDPSNWSAAGAVTAGKEAVNETLQTKADQDQEKSKENAAASAATERAAQAAISARPESNVSDGVPTPANVATPIPTLSSSPKLGANSTMSTTQKSPALSANSSMWSTPTASPGGTRKLIKGMMAVQQDLVKAAQWYKKAADHSHIRGINNLGELYMTGRGVPRNDVTGFLLFKRAAIGGLPEAEYNVGRCYREGRGCERNEDEAIKWFLKAQAQGIKEATRALASGPPPSVNDNTPPPPQQQQSPPSVVSSSSSSSTSESAAAESATQDQQ